MRGLAIDVMSVLVQEGMYHSTNFLIEVHSERVDSKAFNRLQTLLRDYDGRIQQDKEGRLYLTQRKSHAERLDEKEKEKETGEKKEGEKEAGNEKGKEEGGKQKLVVTEAEKDCTGSKGETWKESPTKQEERKGVISTLTELSNLLVKMKWVSLCNNNRLCRQVIACIGKNEKGDYAVFFYDSVSNAFIEQPTNAILHTFNLVAGVNKISIYSRTDFVKKEIKIVTPASASPSITAAKSTISAVDGGLKDDKDSGSEGVPGGGGGGGEKRTDGGEEDALVISEGDVSFNLFTYKSSDKLVVMDIDGTVTISDVRGYFESVFLGVYSYVHQGVVSFLNMLEETYQLKIIFLTSRPLSHYMETKTLLRNVRDTFYEVDANGKKGKRQVKSTVEMPEAPVFCNLTSISSAVYGELIAKTTVSFKSGVLLDIKKRFLSARRVIKELAIQGNADEGRESSAAANRSVNGNNGIKANSNDNITSSDNDDDVFALGIGNKDTDMQAYQIAGIASRRCFLIGTDSKIRIPSDAIVTNGAKNTATTTHNDASKKKSSKKDCDMNVYNNYVDENLLSYVDALYTGFSRNLIDNSTGNGSGEAENGNTVSHYGNGEMGNTNGDNRGEGHKAGLQSHDDTEVEKSKDPQKRVSLSLGVKCETMDR